MLKRVSLWKPPYTGVGANYKRYASTIGIGLPVSILLYFTVDRYVERQKTQRCDPDC